MQPVFLLDSFPVGVYFQTVILFCEYDKMQKEVFMKSSIGLILGLAACFVFIAGIRSFAEEMYILSTRDGSEIIVKEFHFTDENIEFTTGNGLPGFIKKENLVKISNMIGVQPAPVKEEPIEKIKQRELGIWIATATALVFLYLLFLLYVIRKRKGARTNDGRLLPGRIEKRVKTQGHLGFTYREIAGRKTDWVIEVKGAYEEDGVLFVEGVCTTTDKKKTFRADRVEGPVRDMSSGRQCRMEVLFTDA